MALTGGVHALFHRLEAQDGTGGSSLRNVMKMAVLLLMGVGLSPAARRAPPPRSATCGSAGAKADQRIPEAEHRPRRAGSEAREQDHVDHRPAARAENTRGHPKHGDVSDDVEHQHETATAREFRDGLEARGCRKAQPRRRTAEEPRVSSARGVSMLSVIGLFGTGFEGRKGHARALAADIWTAPQVYAT